MPPLYKDKFNKKNWGFFRKGHILFSILNNIVKLRKDAALF